MKSLIAFQLFFCFLIWQFCFLAYSTATIPANETLTTMQVKPGYSPLREPVTNASGEKMEEDMVLKNDVTGTLKWELTELTEEEKILYDYLEAYSIEVRNVCLLVQNECWIENKDEQECEYVTQKCFFQNVKHCFQNNALNRTSAIEQVEPNYSFFRHSAGDTLEERMEKDRILRNTVRKTFKWESTKLTEEEKPLYDDLEACSTEVNQICNSREKTCLVTAMDQQDCRYVTQRCFFQNVSQCLKNKSLI